MPASHFGFSVCRLLLDVAPPAPLTPDELETELGLVADVDIDVDVEIRFDSEFEAKARLPAALAPPNAEEGTMNRAKSAALIIRAPPLLPSPPLPSPPPRTAPSLAVCVTSAVASLRLLLCHFVAWPDCPDCSCWSIQSRRGAAAPHESMMSCVRRFAKSARDTLYGGLCAVLCGTLCEGSKVSLRPPIMYIECIGYFGWFVWFA